MIVAAYIARKMRENMTLEQKAAALRYRRAKNRVKNPLILCFTALAGFLLFLGYPWGAFYAFLVGGGPIADSIAEMVIDHQEGKLAKSQIFACVIVNAALAVFFFGIIYSVLRG